MEINQYTHFVYVASSTHTLYTYTLYKYVYSEYQNKHLKFSLDIIIHMLPYFSIYTVFLFQKTA